MDLKYTGLIMEFVATRDISPGEEILIDYGARWQKAWDEHVKTWKPEPSHEHYSPAWELNDYTMSVRTQAEQQSDPYPKNIWIGCYVVAVDEEQSGEVVNGKLQYKWTYDPLMYHTNLDVDHCEILERYKEDKETADAIRPVGELYKVRLHRHRQMPWTITDVPRRAIQFFDMPYTSDLALENAFRHEMDLPSHMFPEAWKDVVEEEDKEEVEVDEADKAAGTGSSRSEGEL